MSEDFIAATANKSTARLRPKGNSYMVLPKAESEINMQGKADREIDMYLQLIIRCI